MRQRASIAVAVAMLLVVAAGGTVARWAWTHHQGRAPDGQMLSASALWSLATYKRGCLKQADCEAPLSCTWDPRYMAHHCLGNECDTDANCELGLACRAIRSAGSPVRLCLPAGSQKEDERCLEFPLKKEQACAESLVCNQSFCGRSCGLGDPSSCPEDHTCLDSPNGPSCVPVCPRRGCPPGKSCIPIKGDFSVCGEIVGDDCRANPCPDGEECWWDLFRMSDLVRMGCHRPCDEARPCPKGLACFRGSCMTPCDHTKKEDCKPPQVCGYYPQHKLAFCSQ